MIVDAHQHFWDPQRGDYDWLTPDMALHKPFCPDDLEPLLAQHGVDATILVQAAPTEAETNYLLDIARRTSWVTGVVGWIDLAAPDAAAAVEDRAQAPYFVGVRPMLQDLPDRAWILRDDVRSGLAAVVERGIVFDALIRHDQLPVVEELARREPRLKIVIDHAAKPPFGRTDEMRDWAVALARLAEHTNVQCKLSGLATELPEHAELGAATECVSRLFEWFGPRRLMWGSDWPVLTLRSEFGTWLDFCRAQVERHGSQATGQVLGLNAREVYQASRGR